MSACRWTTCNYRGLMTGSIDQTLHPIRLIDTHKFKLA
jgi:hypothetical protein